MSTFRTPVGPQPSKVYWRRRLMVLLGLVAVIVIVILIVQQPRGSAPTGSGSNTPPAPSGSPSSSATSDDPADAIACDLSKVTIEASTDAAGYDPGVDPVLSFVLTSRATSPCTVPGGSDIQEFRITSGEELIWSSKDCQVDPVEGTALLQPGVPFAGPTLTWDRTRSSTDTCNTERPEVIANGASYHLEVIVGELKSESTRQFLLY